MIKSIVHIFKKELRQYLFSPIAYIVGAVFHAIIGYFFYNSLLSYSRAAIELAGSGRRPEVFTPTVVIMEGLIRSMGTIFLLLTPLLTMRLVAEEKRARTIEMLFTSPLPLGAIVIGKFLAAYFIYCLIVGISVYIPLVLDVFTTINWAHVLGGYLGLVLIGGAMLSVGIFASSLTDKQVVAAVLTIGILVVFWFIGGGIGAASQRVTEFLRNIALYTPFRNMFQGLIDLRDIFYFLSFTFFNLFLSYRVLEVERF